MSIEQYKKRFFNLMESEIGDVKPLISEQVINTTAEQLLANNSSEVNKNIGFTADKLNKCFKWDVDNRLPSTYGVGGTEIDNYIDYLNMYGKVPGTSIPIPFEGNDLKEFIQLLQGTGSASESLSINGSIEKRISQQKGGVWYPAVELIRAIYNGRTGDSLYEDLSEKMTDSDEDIKLKNQIKSMLINAYQVWIDCANGKRKEVQ